MPTKNKKTLDIIPPQTSDKPGQGMVAEPKQETGTKKSLSSLLLLIFVGIALSGAALYFLIPQKAEITIWPKTAEVRFETNKEISGKFYRTEKAENEEEAMVPEHLYSFGKREIETKARGTIRVYNSFHLDQVLIPTTRFWCGGEEDKEFITEERVTIPAGGHLDVEVVASSPGKNLNIGPCKVFSVPGLAGTSLYTAVYGESSSPMKGGESFVEFLVVERSELENIAREYVLSQISENQRIQDGSLAVDYSSPSADLEEEKISLILEVSARIYTVTNETSLKRAISGIHPEQIKGIVAEFPEIDEARFKLWPFWTSRIPEDPASIDINFNI